MRAPTPPLPRRMPRATRALMPRATRVLASLWLVLYAFIAAALPLADARADHDAAVVVHMEDGTGSDCPARHDASVCHTCQVLNSPLGTTVAGAGCPATVSRRESPAVTFESGSDRLTQRGQPTPRAPPRA